MPKKKAAPKVEEKALSKGDLRSLTASRKKYGDKLAEKWFAEHLQKREAKGSAAPQDKNADLIAETLNKLITEKRLAIPRGGYNVTRGRGRVIVTIYRRTSSVGINRRY